jgi:hypothetical protein
VQGSWRTVMQSALEFAVNGRKGTSRGRRLGSPLSRGDGTGGRAESLCAGPAVPLPEYHRTAAHGRSTPEDLQFAATRLNTYSSRIVSATLSTSGTRGWVSSKSLKVKAVAAVPVTPLSLKWV